MTTASLQLFIPTYRSGRHGRTHGRNDPHVTITKGGAIQFNQSLVQELGSPSKVVLLVDPETRTIGVRAAHESDHPHAVYALQPIGKSASRYVSGAALFSAHNWEKPKASTHYTPVIQDSANGRILAFRI